MYRLLVVSVAMLIAACSGPIPPAVGQAPSDNLTWTLATQFEDGSALTVGTGPKQIKETLIQFGVASGGPYATGNQRIAAPGTSAVFNRAAPGYGIRCYVAFTVLNDGTMSNATNEVCKTIAAPPKAPSGLAVN